MTELTISYVAKTTIYLNIPDNTLTSEEIEMLENSKLAEFKQGIEKGVVCTEEDYDVSWSEEPIAKPDPYMPPTEQHWFTIGDRRWATNNHFVVAEDSIHLFNFDRFVQWSDASKITGEKPYQKAALDVFSEIIKHGHDLASLALPSYKIIHPGYFSKEYECLRANGANCYRHPHELQSESIAYIVIDSKFVAALQQLHGADIDTPNTFRFDNQDSY
jgi:hypothetical protein